MLLIIIWNLLALHAFLRLKLLELCLIPSELQTKKQKSIKHHKHSNSFLYFNSLFWVIFIMEVRLNDMHYALSYSWQYSAIKIIVKNRERLNILLHKWYIMSDTYN